MTALPQSARELLESDALAHLVTINQDGSPQVTCVWVGVDGDEVVLGSLNRNVKLRNIERDPRVCFSVQGRGVNAFGLTEYLVVNGRARIEPGGAPELLRRLARVYLGPDVPFPPMPNPPPGYVVRIAVDRLGGVGPWAER